MWVAQNCIQWKVYFSPIPDHPPPSQGQFLVTQGQFSCSRSNSVPVKRAAPVRVYAVMFDPLRLCGLQPARLLCPWDSPGKNTGAGCHSFLQGIFPAQGSNPRLLHWRVDSLTLLVPVTMTLFGKKVPAAVLKIRMSWGDHLGLGWAPNVMTAVGRQKRGGVKTQGDAEKKAVWR